MRHGHTSYLRPCIHHHSSSSSNNPPNRTAFRSGSGPSANTTNARCAPPPASPLSFPRNLANKRPPELQVGVRGGTLDAPVDDALAVSGVTLELVVAALLPPPPRGFLSAERAGGGKRREGERCGECERDEDGAAAAQRWLELGLGCGCGTGEETLRCRRGVVVGAPRCAGMCGVRERWRPIAICW